MKMTNDTYCVVFRGTGSPIWPHYVNDGEQDW
jgi:hypothetical protein